MGTWMSFENLGLSDPLLKAVADSGYTEPTPIQRQAIPTILQGRDVLGIAQTGTGKTGSFTLPMIDILAEGRSRARMPRSLILEPTRELAVQVSESFERYGKYHKLTMALLIGGVGFADQDRLLERGVDVLIATPGRLLDQFERSKILLSGVEILVIDEADRMLDMGFIPDVERLCTLLPVKRQTLFFSATMPGPIKRLVEKFLSNPKTIEVSRPATTVTAITQQIVNVAPREKRNVLRALLREEPVQNAIIFCNRKVEVRNLHDSLKRHGLGVGQLHGDMEQSDRLAVLERFRSGDIPLLVASDVAARGLDIASVSHVFNFDVPIHADDYVHRIGRTGRAGRSGMAITLATGHDAEHVEAIEKLTGHKLAERRIAGEAAPPADETQSKPHPGGERKRRNRGKSAQPDKAGTAPARTEPQPAPARETPGRDDGETGWGMEIPAFLRRPARN